MTVTLVVENDIEVVANAYLRVDKAVTKMIESDHADLVRVMVELLHVVKNQARLPAAFACLAVAEHCLLDAAEPLLDHEWLRLRSLAVSLAERVAAGSC
jgi:hypothetical protein